MNGAAIFFFFGLPAVIAAVGWGAVYLHERSLKTPPHHHPAE